MLQCRHANALALQVKLRDAVLAQGDERDPAEVGHNGMLQHHLGQMVGGVARDVVEADAVSSGRTEQWYERHRKGSESWAATECLLSCQRW